MANPTSRILWWALVASLVLYAGVAQVVDLPANPNTEISLLLPVFIFLSVSTGVGTLLYRRRALSGPIQSHRTRSGSAAFWPPGRSRFHSDPVDPLAEKVHPQSV